MPAFRLLAAKLENDFASGRAKYRLQPFEGFRSLAHQQEALRRGVSKAPPWSSAHQYGLAVDYVPLRDYGDPRSWFWPNADDPIWALLGEQAVNCGLIRNISWDKPHVEHPIWNSIRRHVA